MRKKAIKHSLKERLEKRKFGRKHGPAALRRVAHRHAVVRTLECGCKVTRVCVETCEAHTLRLTEPSDDPLTDAGILEGAPRP